MKQRARKEKLLRPGRQTYGPVRDLCEVSSASLFRSSADSSPHQQVARAIRADDLEPLLREHRHRSVRGRVSESRSVSASADPGTAELFPGDDGIAFHDPPSPFSDGFQRGFQRRRRHPAPAILLIHHETGDSPEPCRVGFRTRRSIFATVVDPRKLFAGAVSGAQALFPCVSPRLPPARGYLSV